jgi:hypothetical protein
LDPTQNAVTEQGEPAPGSNGRKDAEQSSLARPPRMLRVRLWQAIAGMCIAVTIWSLIVMSVLTGRLVRTSHFANRRVAALNATVRTLRNQKASEQRKLGSERERASVGEVFEKILFAPDLRTIKLAAPVEKDRAREKSGASDLPSGTLAMSESADAAMLEATGLKPTGTFQVYRIWWMPRRGAPIWAADFLVADDGTATVPVDLPTGREKAMSLGITLEDESYSEEPAGPMALKGELSLVSGIAQGPRKSRR